jgi:hypothetical protein
MPQPYRRKQNNPGSGVRIWSMDEQLFDLCPELSQKALSAIASWSRVDMGLLRVFVHMMGGAESMTASVYVSLGSQSAKSAAINAVADKALIGQESAQKILRKLLKKGRINQRFRDKLAHWIWGFDHTQPNALVLIDPRIGRGALHKKDMARFTSAEFDSYLACNEKLFNDCQRFIYAIAAPGSSKSERYLQMLLSDPDFQ